MPLSAEEKEKLKQDPRFSVLRECFDDFMAEYETKKAEEAKKKQEGDGSIFDALFGR